MTRSRWWSQPVAAEGSTSSEGIRRQLGKPQLDPLTVLVRETAQNTCDAALPGTQEIEFSVRLQQLSGTGLAGWREFLLPEPAGSGLGLHEAMHRDPIVLSISDRGTTGLGGPLRADESPLPGERPDFVNFIRNVGERKSVELGGGSYGFGKGILYNVSRCHVVVADSVCEFRGNRQRRLIAAALGDGYSLDGRRFTGRHWLGIAEPDGHTRPLLDAEADAMAAQLGLPPFASGDTGTTVTVVDVDLGRRTGGDDDQVRSPQQAADWIASTMLWNLWPRMLHGRPHRLICDVRRDGFRTPVPEPESVIELAPFVEAYHAVHEEGRYRVPRRIRPPREIGRFALSQKMAPPHRNPLIAAAAPFEGPAHHCARMRQADLVVDYIPGDPDTDEMVQYGAVFRAGAEADPFFAEAEPPTHDAWVLTGLRGTARGVVQLADRFVAEQMRDRRGPTGSATPAGQTPLAALAGRLSGLVTADGDRADASGTGGRAPGGGGGRRGNSRPRFTSPPQLVDEDGAPVIRAVVELPAWPTPHVVTVEPVVVVDGGVETDSEIGAPEVIGWVASGSGVAVAGPEIVVDRGSDRVWQVRVRPVPDAVVRLRLTERATGATG